MMLAGNESQEDNLLILFAASRSVTSAMAKPNSRARVWNVWNLGASCICLGDLSSNAKSPNTLYAIYLI